MLTHAEKVKVDKIIMTKRTSFEWSFKNCGEFDPSARVSNSKKRWFSLIMFDTFFTFLININSL